jgi:large subunit ribosomal protein L3
MTQILNDKADVVPVTKVSVLPCFVVEKKTVVKDGYSAIKVACDEVKSANRPIAKFFEKIFGGPKYFRILKEFRMEESDPMFAKLEVGQKFDAGIFVVGDEVSVTGFSKGRGFQGVVKRHGFAGAPKTHGNKDQLRMPGSIGATHPNHVFKGVRMAGHMGDAQITVKGLEVVATEPSENVIYIKGAVPGARTSLLFVEGNGEFDVKSATIVEAPKMVEETAQELKGAESAGEIDQV